QLPEDPMRATSELHLIEGGGEPPERPGAPEAEANPPIFSELEAFVRTEVGLREALQQQLDEAQRETAAMREASVQWADATDRISRAESAERALATRLDEVQEREELAERVRAELVTEREALAANEARLEALAGELATREAAVAELAAQANELE